MPEKGNCVIIFGTNISRWKENKNVSRIYKTL